MVDECLSEAYVIFHNQSRGEAINTDADNIFNREVDTTNGIHNTRLATR